MGLDGGSDAIPRYLIPATKSAWETSRVKADPYYLAIQVVIREAQAYPNVGVEPIRRSMRNQIDSLIRN
jgi:thiamine pyridinylase